MEEVRLREVYSHPGDGIGKDKDKSGHDMERIRPRGARTNLRQHRKGQVKTWKGSERARELTSWRQDRKGEVKTRKDKGKKSNVRHKEKEADPKLMVTF